MSKQKHLTPAPCFLPKLPPFKMGAIAGTLLLATLSTGAYGQIYHAPITYDGTSLDGTAKNRPLSDSATTDVKGVLPPTLGINTADVGVIYKMSGVIIGGSTYGSPYSANVTIHYASGPAPKFVIGGYAEGAAVSVSDDSVYRGAFSLAHDNIVKVTQGEVDGPIFVGLSNIAFVRGDATGVSGTDASADSNVKIDPIILNHGATLNTLMIDGVQSVVSGNVNAGYGGVWIQTGNVIGGTAVATGNTDALTNATTNVAFDGQHTLVADHNDIDVQNNAFIGGVVYGGNASIIIKTGDATAGSATADTGTSSATADSSIDLNKVSISASVNTIDIGQVTIGGGIYGGYAELNVKSGNAQAGSVSGNGTIENSATSAINANTVALHASQNDLQFNGELQSGSIYGGYIKFELAAGTATGTTSTSNAIDITGTNATATSNTITIGEHAKFNSSNTSLYGGSLEYSAGLAPESFDIYSNNTLNYSAREKTQLHTVANFENYNFTINPAYVNSSTALITAQNISLDANASNNTQGLNNNSKVTVLGIHSGQLLNPGDKFILMKSTGSFDGVGQGDSFYGVVQQGISFLYDVRTDIDVAGKKVTATILGDPASNTNRTINPQLKALSEGYLAGNMIVARGGDTIAYDAINTIHQQNIQKGYAPFIMVTGQHNRYNSGSHIKSNDYLVSTGLSYQQDNLTAGAFVEAGWGSYDSYNSFSNVASVHGDGKNNYYGVGVLGRYDFENNIYMDGSLRVGQNQNKFDSADIVNSTSGEKAHYSLKSNYISGHVGTGYIVDLNQQNQLDLSAKYLWTRFGGKNATVAGDPIHFDEINSHRVRLDTEVKHAYNEQLTLRAGLGYEYEFDGKARATTYGTYDIDAPSLKGSTGIVSIGASIKPTTNERLTLDVNARGYAGKHEGVGLHLNLNYAF